VTWPVVSIFLAAALVAALFAAWPAAKARPARRGAVLAAALAFFVAGFGGGAYLMLGRPDIAARAFSPADARDLNGLIALLVRHMRADPADARGWTMLGKAYLTAGAPGQAARAFARAIAAGAGSAEIYSAYGESLAIAAGGAVPQEAEAAFSKALILNPKDRASRYYLGFAYAARGDNAKAIALWKGLVADAPAEAPWRASLVDRIARLTAKTGAAPDVASMTEGLAARLKAHPQDAGGWIRLVRSYAVMGDKAKALAALKDARAAMAGNSPALAALRSQAVTLGLEN
jgi:cytochrome c-type biogenesis protein CcmH